MARRIKFDDLDEDVSLDKVVSGDRLRVRPGERVPVDGEILDGRSAIDEFMVTGEKTPGDEGDRREGHRRYDQPVRRLRDARRQGRPRHDARADRANGRAGAAEPGTDPQRLADTVSSWFVPAVIAIALLAFAAWSIWGPQPRLTFGISNT